MLTDVLSMLRGNKESKNKIYLLYILDKILQILDLDIGDLTQDRYISEDLSRM